MIYCFDSNAFIQPWTQHYPPDVFPDFWIEIERMGMEGTILATDEVLKELERIEDKLYGWAKSRPFLFREPDEQVQQYVRDILAHPEHQRLVHVGKNRSMADPFVIAQARASRGCVVSEERRVAGRKKVKIPDVCGDLDIRCLSVIDFMREIGLAFRKA